MEDAKSVLEVVSVMIEHAPELLPRPPLTLLAFAGKKTSVRATAAATETLRPQEEGESLLLPPSP